ncbi:hypothetical protein CYMTET_4487 [Cymbomonas tetramitiformis]|uniref:Uncharacterized protein n=1 Tax=Cymbomonas tetramitiformis TaxID=36881 RepID=A0AAE0LK25_9CHLO|nr:hypothetical protein CYMTET_4487 [Cymbomonas tetramitiformis]
MNVTLAPLHTATSRLLCQRERRNEGWSPVVLQALQGFSSANYSRAVLMGGSAKELVGASRQISAPDAGTLTSGTIRGASLRSMSAQPAAAAPVPGQLPHGQGSGVHGQSGGVPSTEFSYPVMVEACAVEIIKAVDVALGKLEQQKKDCNSPQAGADGADISQLSGEAIVNKRSRRLQSVQSGAANLHMQVQQQELQDIISGDKGGAAPRPYLDVVGEQHANGTDMYGQPGALWNNTKSFDFEADGDRVC